MDRIGTPEIIDIALVGAVVLLGALGAWRGIVKEMFISVALLLSLVISQQWTNEWTARLVDWFDIGPDRAELIVRIGVPIIGSVFIGYVASVNAGIPPADVPGRVGGFVVGAMNAVFLFAIVGAAVYSLELDRSQQQTVADTHILRALIIDFDRVVLLMAAVALMMSFVSVSIRRRRMAILAPTKATRAGSSGYQIRRSTPLAPEAEKIETVPERGRTTNSSLSETVPLSRVSDPSTSGDRPVPAQSGWSDASGSIPPPSSAEVVRCLSCGERLTGDDRFCPRCGRSLVR